MANRISVLVTGIGGYGGQIVKALRLAQEPYEVIGTDTSPLCGTVHDVDKAFIVSKALSSEFIEEILWICKEHLISAIFPGTEVELRQFGLHREKFERYGIFLPINSNNVIDICLDKWKTIEWLKKAGYRYPETVQIKSSDDLGKCGKFPIVLKPAIGGSGSANVYVVQNEKELSLFGTYLLNSCGEFIAQEYIGSVDSEYTVGVLCDMDGLIINSIAVKRNIISGLSCKSKVKNHSGNSSLGDILAISSGITQGEIGAFEEVTKPCEELATRLGARSAINIQCRVVDGEVYVFEINPRFSGTTSFRAMVGYNEPDVLLKKYILGEKTEKYFSYGKGYIVRDLREVLLDNEKAFNTVNAFLIK